MTGLPLPDAPQAPELRPLPLPEPAAPSSLRRPEIRGGTGTIAAANANRVRGQWLTELASGQTTLEALLLEAASAAGHPLRRIPVLRLLAVVRGTSQNAQRSTLTRMLDLVGVHPIDLANDATRRRFTIGWLVAEGTAGQRVRVLAEVLSSYRGAPWPGFPMNSDPRNRSQQSGGVLS